MSKSSQPRRSIEISEEEVVQSTSPSKKPFRKQDVSEQQSVIVQMAQAPGIGSCCRITAAAGTGKTTTLELMSSELLRKGHLSKNVCYLTFNKTAVADAEKRLSYHVKCKSLHGCAFTIMGVEYDNFYPMDDITLELQIGIFCAKNIDNFLRKMPMKEKLDIQIRKRTIKTVIFYIRKTLNTFVQSKKSVLEGFDPKVFNTTYYPAAGMYMYVYIFTYICIYTYIYIFIFIYV
jgi:superfamily I DNA/RNA helicase